jgi:hypothetical protein
MRRFSAIPLLLLLLSGCSGSPTASSVDPGTFVGRWDGSRWEGHAYAVLQNDTLFIIAHRPDPEYFYDEFIRAKLPYTGPGSYAVPEPDGELMKITGGDAGHFPRAGGTLTVHGYSSHPHRISGQLELTADHFGTLWTADGEFDAPVYSSFGDIPWKTRNRS